MKKDDTQKTEYGAFESALRKILAVPKDAVKKAGKAKVKAKKPKKKP